MKRSTEDVRSFTVSRIARTAWRLTSQDDVDTFLGMPVGVQIVGRKGTDEQVLRMAEIIDS